MSFSNENFAITVNPLEAEAYVSDFFGGVTLAGLTIVADGYAGGAPWSAAIELPQIVVTGDTNFGWDAAIEVTQVEVSATGVTSNVASGAVVVSNVKISATAKRSGAGATTLPMLSISAEGWAEIDWGAPALEVPQVELTALVETTLAAVFEAWCLNLNSAGVSEYTNFPITSMVYFNGKYYGTTSDGIYELAGADDAGTAIDADVLTGITDYSYEGEKGDASMTVKRSSGAYVNLRSQGGFSVVAKVDEDKERVYTLTAAADPKGFHPRRVNLGRLLEGRNWQFGFKNISGADFSLRDFQNFPIYTSRRV